MGQIHASASSCNISCLQEKQMQKIIKHWAKNITYVWNYAAPKSTRRLPDNGLLCRDRMGARGLSSKYMRNRATYMPSHLIQLVKVGRWKGPDQGLKCRERLGTIQNSLSLLGQNQTPQCGSRKSTHECRSVISFMSCPGDIESTTLACVTSSQ